MKKGSAILGIILVVIIVIIGWGVGTYNGLISSQEKVAAKYSDLDVMLQRRADLVPNLVSTVKGYTSHETEIIDKVTTARTKLLNANTVAEKSAADEELTSFLKALMVVVENYPDLKASENFTQLSDELAGTENRIATARKDYNSAVSQYNTSIKRFPGSIFAGMFGFEAEAYFEASSASAEVPSVSFE